MIAQGQRRLPATVGGPGALLLSSVLLLAIASCEQVEQVQDRFRDMTPYEAYQASLSDAGLEETALGRDWLAAGRTAVDDAAPITLPFEEEGFIASEEPGAMAYRITIGRGQKLSAEVTLESEEGARIFVDLLRAPASESDPARPVYSSATVPDTFEHEPWRGGEFILRVQPELLRGGQYRVKLHLEAQLAFPVDGYDSRAVQSFFGADRDAGRRSHDGVDIFARRGTPVLATSAGVINRVNVTNLGGKVVWLRDPVRNANIYFAHLDSQHVANGDRVERGDTIGFVGNTGNARTTPPHLHFGIYRRGEGPVDPAPFLRDQNRVPPEMTADRSRLGEWVRLSNEGVHLRAAPDARAAVVRELAQHTPFRVLAAAGGFYRVRLPNGVHGYVAARLTEAADQPVAQVVAHSDALWSKPAAGAALMATLADGTQMPVLGRFAGYLMVRAPTGATGWLQEAAQDQP